MEKHKGSIVENAIRKSGFPIKKLAERLGIGRSTLYKHFEEPELSDAFIKTVEEIIHYDFKSDFPDLANNTNALSEASTKRIHQDATKLLKLEKQYINLLERYKKLLRLLAKLSNDSELKALRDEVYQFLLDNNL